MNRKEEILNYLKTAGPSFRFPWAKTQKWAAKYETVNTLSKATKIPKSSIYKALRELKGTEGFMFSNGLIGFEQCVDGSPNELEPVLALITHQSDLGKSEWYEVVYFFQKWQSYAGSKTFQDGEQVVKWKYVKDCL